MSVGVIAHLDNPSIDDIERLARAAEEAGAAWLGIADAFWWRDTWLLAAAAGRATSSLTVGPVVTNPYLRHRFHTYASIATLQEMIGDRVVLGVGAGGSEVSGAAHVSRVDAGRRIAELVDGLRAVAAGAPLDPVSGRRLDVALTAPRVMVAGRGDGVLRASGRVADDALLWAIPQSDLARSVQVITGAASDAGRDRPRLVWAPLVTHTAADVERARTIAAYGIVNASPALRAAWGVGDDLVAEVRRRLVSGGAAAAAALVPDRVVHDVAVGPDAPAMRATIAELGIGAMAVPAHTIDEVGDRVAFARSLLD
ncbi:MAG: LLM class flavin-dependent oxidoreductase [Acidimicrobiales bacterium]|nr:LLM class flavin-dependent oxidoreductase [Acidimicrobiales bacterium]MCB9393407.1 LLM class flavin-dependent oxidoreductase [Acidimicrobiaceae bacterium]